MSNQQVVSDFNRNPLLSWEFFFIKILLFALAAVLISKPSGSISGRIAMEQDGFNLYSYNMRQHKVYAIATGPRESTDEQERGVWVDQDGRFQIDQLPVGEYSLKIRVPGFSTTYESGIFVSEAQVTELNQPVTLQISEPSISAGANCRVFTTKEKPSFWVHAQSATNMEVKLFKKDMLSILGTPDENRLGVEVSTDLSVYKPYETEKRLDLFDKQTPLKSWTRKLTPDVQDWAYESFKCEEPLPAGDYFALIEGSNVRLKSDKTLVWFTVTDLGLIVKQDYEKTVVRAVDLNNLSPVEGVSVELRSRGQDGGNGKKNELKLLSSSKNLTGKDGFLEFAASGLFKDGTNANLLVCGFKNGQHAYGGMSMYRGVGEQHKTYFYTERPIYRLGQTVYFKGICRDLEGNGFKNPGQMKLSLSLEDPDNSEIWSGKVTSNKFGTFHGVLELPKEGKTGAYQIVINYPDGTTDYERIEVDEYRKPEYKVDVYALETRVNAGSKARARVKAMYYFGAPVSNAKIKYTIYSSNDWYGRYKLQSRPEYYSYFDDWSGSDRDYYYGGDYICEGMAQTNEAGEAIIEFDSKAGSSELEGVFDAAYDDKKYKIEVEVTDISRLAVQGSGNVSVTPGDFVLFVEPKNYVAKVGEKIAAEIKAVDYEGNPVVSKKVQVQMLRRIWDRNESYYRGLQNYETVEVSTDKDGKATVEFDTKAKYYTDTYYLVASAKDAENHQIRSYNTVWVASEYYPDYAGEQAQKEPLAVKLDKEVYKPGETIRAMISAPVGKNDHVQAIVSVEGVKLHKYQAVDLKAGGTLIELPIEKHYAPNVHLSVCLVGKKRQFYNTSQIVKIAPQENFLTISVSPDKKKYHPGENAVYTLKAVDSLGKPAANVELSMGVVDESIYAIRPEYVQDIRKFFYSERPNNVSTICSFPEEYSGGPNKIEPRVRKDFRDTAAWFPNLVTDKNGEAVAKFKMPDNLTTWRATVRGVSLQAQVGWILQKTVSSQDLIVRLALPRFYNQNDESDVSCIVHNYSDKVQDLRVSLALSPQFQLKGKPLTQSLKLEPEKVARLSWPVRVLSPGTGVISVKAIGQNAGDAMESKLPIRAHGVPVFASRSGLLSAEDETLELPIQYPEDASAGSVEMSLHLSPSALSSVLGNFNSLIDYPYGCTEQTMSKLMPAVVAVKMNKKLGVPLKKADLDKFKDVYSQSMEKLDGYQHGDGGWGWWANDESNVYLTALVLEGYKLLDESGYHIDKDRLKNGLAWLSGACKKLQTQLSDPLHLKDWWHDNELMNDMAKATYVQSLYGIKADKKLVEWLRREAVLNHLSPESLSYYCLALSKGGETEAEKDAARQFFDRLIYLANSEDSSSGALINWEPCPALYAKLASAKSDYVAYQSYRFTGVETTALALRACLEMAADRSDRIESIKSWILTERGKDGWGNTKTTAEVFKALMADELSRIGTQKCLFDADLIQGNPVQGNSALPDAAATTTNEPGNQNKLSFSANSLFAPEQVIKLRAFPQMPKPKLHKQGQGRLYWSCVLKYHRKLKPGDNSYVAGTPSGLTISRQFSRLKASYDSSGNVHFKEEPLTGSVKAGETLLMSVRLNSPISVPYTLLEIPLPSGAEVVKDDPKERLAEHDSSASILRSWWWTHRDIMDDHLAFFVSNYKAGVSEIRTMVRLELPGKYQMNPVTLEGMYTDNVHGYSTANEILVED